LEEAHVKRLVLAMALDDKKQAFSTLMTYGTLGIEMGVSLAIGLAIGYFLDRHFGTAPVFLIIFMIFGIIAGMRRVYALWKRMEKEDERNDRNGH
jgi:ATP synthase protein I